MLTSGIQSHLVFPLAASLVITTNHKPVSLTNDLQAVATPPCLNREQLNILSSFSVSVLVNFMWKLCDVQQRDKDVTVAGEFSKELLKMANIRPS